MKKLFLFTIRSLSIATLLLMVVVPQYHLFADSITRVSVGTNVQGNATSSNPRISSDGRFVVFHSDATNLVPGDTNGATDVFVYDTELQTTTRVSVDSNGVQGNGTSEYSSISADGRYVTFHSEATNLIASDTNSRRDIFLHDTQTGTTTRVSVDSNGVESNNHSSNARISADGRYISFSSIASNLIASDTNARRDIFRHDTQTGATIRVSVSTAGVEANNDSEDSSISADGQYISFESLATNLVAGDTNAAYDIFLRDVQGNTTTRVSVDSNGVEANDNNVGSKISSDGTRIAFYSSATNLVTGDTNGFIDVFLHDTDTGETTLISVDSDGNQSDNDSYAAVNVSPNGRYVAFESQATNLVLGDTNAAYDIFLHDTLSGITTRVSVDSNGVQADGDSFVPALSSDARFIAFHSDATNLVTGDTNGVRDIFIYDTHDARVTQVMGATISGSRAFLLARKNHTNTSATITTCPYFSEYLMLHDKDVHHGGTKHQVSLLQKFIADQGFGPGLVIDGIFGTRTRDAVIAWQNHYAKEVLSAWSSLLPAKATGYFYKASRRWANMQQGCAESVTLDNGTTLPADSSRLNITY